MDYENNYVSMRFYPRWNKESGGMVAGLIDLVFDIYKMDPDAANWVEIGTYGGESALLISSFSFVKKLKCVDKHFCGWRWVAEKRLASRIREGRVELFEMSSEEFSRQIDDSSLDVVYIDGDHSKAGMDSDVKCWWPKVRPGGFLCGHDFCDVHPGVVSSVVEFSRSHGFVVRMYEDRSFLIRKPT